MQQRISNRRYPKRNCAKRGCPDLFEPHYKNQLYCCRQHQIDENNDRRDDREALAKEMEKERRKNERILEATFTNDKRLNLRTISQETLELQAYSFDIFSIELVDEKTGSRVRWLYQYGLQRSPDGKTFIIHKKPNNQ